MDPVFVDAYMYVVTVTWLVLAVATAVMLGDDERFRDQVQEVPATGAVLVLVIIMGGAFWMLFLPYVAFCHWREEEAAAKAAKEET